MYTLEEPVTSASVFAQFLVMRLAKDFVKVLLDGQGADEQLAGYHYFFGFYYKELFSRLRWDLLVYELFSFLKKHRSLYALKSLGYLFLTQGIQTKLKFLERKYINRSFFNDFSPSPVIIDNLYHSSSLRNSLINHFEFKLEHLLKWEDRNSMCFSIESRVPFLDYRLVEKTLALPSREILHKGTTKYILRDAMKNILPEKIRIRQSKIGFGTPAHDWFKTTEFRKYILEILNDNEFKENPYIDTAVCMRLYQMHLDGRINIDSEIWKWINTNWFLNNVKNQVV
jgi:asparagine synthase (glutamine-hydrolysing)